MNLRNPFKRRTDDAKPAQFDVFPHTMTDDGHMLIPGVPLFTTGSLENDGVKTDVSAEFLQDMVDKFELDRDSDKPWLPQITSGHTDGKNVPSVGKHVALSTDGETLFADWEIVDPTVQVQLLNGNWPGRSIEIPKTLDGGLVPHLGGTALLGSSQPYFSELPTLELSQFAADNGYAGTVWSAQEDSLPTLDDAVDAVDEMEPIRKEASARIEKARSIGWKAEDLIWEISNNTEKTVDERKAAIQAIIDRLPELIDEKVDEPVTDDEIANQFQANTNTDGSGSSANKGGPGMGDPKKATNTQVADDGVQAQLAAQSLVIETQNAAIAQMQATQRTQTLDNAKVRLGTAGLSPAALESLEKSGILAFAASAPVDRMVQFAADDGVEEISPLESILRLGESWAEKAKNGSLVVKLGEDGKVIEDAPTKLLAQMSIPELKEAVINKWCENNKVEYDKLDGQERVALVKRAANGELDIEPEAS